MLNGKLVKEFGEEGKKEGEEEMGGRGTSVKKRVQKR